MSFLNATILGFTAWQIYLSAALLLTFAGFVAWRAATSGSPSDDGKRRWRMPFAEQHMSTTRLTDTQRIDRLERVILLTPGEYANLSEITFGSMPKLHITYHGIEHANGQEFAHLKLELGGATADCGAAVEELGDNDFLVPRATLDVQRCSIHYTSNKIDVVSFLQVKVKKIDINDGSVAIDVLHVRGRQRAA